jgi:hypothetical protein
LLREGEALCDSSFPLSSNTAYKLRRKKTKKDESKTKADERKSDNLRRRKTKKGRKEERGFSGKRTFNVM